MPSATKVQTGYLEAVNPFSLAPGTASLPTLTFTDNASTGIYSPSSGALAISTGSLQNALTILANGNVGIGTINPTTPLEVQSSTIPRIISNYNNSKHIGMSVGGSGGGFTLTDGHSLSINHQPYADRGTDNNLTERFRIGSDGSTYRGGTVMTEDDMNWGHDTNQRAHIFTGQTGGNPSDAALVLASPETDPSNTRIGVLIYGCKTSSGVGSVNSGIKASIECVTNVNTPDAWKTGAKINFLTRTDNGGFITAQTIDSNGIITKPTQPAFRAYTTNYAHTSGWNKIAFGTEDYDINSDYDHSNHRFTAPVAGRYMFYAGGYSPSTDIDGRYAFSATINGGYQKYLSGAHYGEVDSPLAGYMIIHNLAANDYVELYGFSVTAQRWGASGHIFYWGGYLLG